MTIETMFMEKAPFEMGGHIRYVILKNDSTQYMIHRGEEHKILVSVVKEHEDGSFSIKKTANGIYNASIRKIEPKEDFQKLIGRLFDRYNWPAGPIPQPELNESLGKFFTNLRYNGRKYEDK